MRSLLSHHLTDRSGVAAIEYGLIAALVAVAIITAVTLMGSSLSGTFGDIATSLGATVGV